MVAGSMLGIGIFLSPPMVAGNTDSLWVFFALWLAGGIIALAGAAACAELATMMPRAGGDYVFQREAFGPSVAFASGWVLFATIFAGSIATMAVGVSAYQLPVLLRCDLTAVLWTTPWGFDLRYVELAALGIVAALTWLNVLGAGPSSRTQTLLTVVPLAALAAGAAYALTVAPALPSETAVPVPRAGLGLLVVSYMAVYFAYSGWINIIYVAGEVAEPERNIPIALLWGTASVTALYLLICAGLVHVLGMAGLREAGEAGTAAASVLAGDTGRLLVAVLIASGLLASINGTVLGGARVAYAMGHDGAMWPVLGTLDREHAVPARALWLQAAIAMALIVSGRFEQLYTMVSLAMVVTGTLTVGAVFMLRRSQPDRTRPYRAMGYPWFPALYVGSSLLVIAVMVYEALSGKPGAGYPLLGLGVLIVTYSGHRVWRARTKPRNAAS